MKVDLKKAARIIIPFIIALISIFGVSRAAASPEFHAKTIESLDEKRNTVMELTAASTAASAAITLIPGDTATPIAEKLADLSTYFLVVLCAIYLEKYLVTITGYAAFSILIPAACVLYMVSVFYKEKACKWLANKLIVFGIAIVLIVPASVQLSNLIERTYESSINETIESARQATEEIEGSAGDSDESEDDESGVLSGFFSKITDGVSGVVEKVENILNDFVEALAVMIVTSCVIPIVVIIFFIWLVKNILGMNISIPVKKPR
ncbi:MAG: hypothetical protein ACLU97_08255 [Dorea sp.]|nr:hypothetical protein [Faecalimonas umbilicata]